jgi:hydroxymethylpyrimidine/phosphomethylpyrimidine kinase
VTGPGVTAKYDAVVPPGMTRRRAPVDPPVALTVAGSDSGGGAGVQADLAAMAAHGVFGTSVVTATTAQNTRGVAATEVLPVDHVRAQYRAVVEDFDVRAVKTGMLATAPVVEAVTDLLADSDAPVVVDPVMVAASGDRLLSEAAETAYEDLLGAATLATPNADEAAVLAGHEVATADDARRAGEAIRETGADAVLVKGGHLDGDEVVDTLVTGGGVERFVHPRVETAATHGSGCVLSSAVAARLASGTSLEAAVEAATRYLERAVRYGVDAGEGPGAVNPFVDLRDDAARERTAEAVSSLARSVTDLGVRPLVPDRGLSVVGATPSAETTDDLAAVEGRVVRTRDGVARVGGVRFGSTDPAARALVDARESAPDLRFAVAVRGSAAVERALASALAAAPVPLDDGRVCALATAPGALVAAVERALAADGKTD